MDFVDGSYLAAAALAGCVARAVVRGLPDNWRMRLQARPPELRPGWLWVQAVSVGELMLAEGIVGRMLAAGHRIHVTTGTAAGLKLLEQRLPGWDKGTGRVTGGAFPLDDPQGLAPFLLRPPAAFVSLETEIWPNLLRALALRGIPACIVNGRLTGRSLGRGRAWMERAAARLSLVAARDEASAEAFRRLGAPHVVLGGNLKADLPAPRPLHPGWEPLRAAWRRARADHPGLRLVLAPRQPRRFQAVADLLRAEGLVFRRGSEAWPAGPESWAGTPILLLDTLGELASAYREGTLALVGGGWAWNGGHNPLEPVVWGVPTLIGPGFDNFQDLVEPLLEAGLVRVVPAGRLGDEVAAVLALGKWRPAEAPGTLRLPEALAGALEKTWESVSIVIPTPR